MSEESPAPKRVRLTTEEISALSKEELVTKLFELDTYANELEKKQSDSYCTVDASALEEKLKQNQLESSRKEKVLVMRLTAKEQELQELAAELSKAQNPSTSQLRNSLLDPAINLLFQKMRKETEDSKTKLQQANDDMAAWKFTPDSQTGKRLMSKCRALLLENQELGKQISSGKTAQLEAELALQKKYSEELKTSQDELNEFVIELDEEVEGMQSTICSLQEELKECKEELTMYKNQSKLETTSESNGQNQLPNPESNDKQRTEKYAAPVRTESGPFTVHSHMSNLSVELEDGGVQNEGYRTTNTTERSGTPDDIMDEKMSTDVNENKENRDLTEEQYLEDENQEEVDVKYGWEDRNKEILRNSEEKHLVAENMVNEINRVEEKETDMRGKDTDVGQFRTDSVSDVRRNSDDFDNDTGNETPSYGELSDSEQAENKLTSSGQVHICKVESTYKPNNILTVDPIQKSQSINSDEENNVKGKRTDSPVNGQSLEQHTVTLPLDSAKISLVDGYSSDDGGGSVELSTTKAASNFEQNGLHKLSDGLEDEGMETD